MDSLDPEQLFDPWREAMVRAPHLYLGFSGGLDSTVLLDLLLRTLPGHLPRVIHINHGLMDDSDRWQDHCAHFCHQRGVTFIPRKVTVATAGDGIEQAARQARYDVFNEVLAPGDLLFLGHHGDDQVETVLYRLLRGSGPGGLAGIPASRALGAGTLVRPLLHCSRAELERYARHRQLSWIEDDSNASLDFDRNYLRHQVVPALASRWPDYRQRILRTAVACASADTLATEVAGDDLTAVSEREEIRGWSLALGTLQALSSVRQSNLLRHWIAARSLPVPGHRVLAAVVTDLLPARRDAMPKVSWRGGELRRFGQRLYLLPSWPGGHRPDAVIPWSGDDSLVLPDGAILTVERVRGEGIAVRWQDTLEVRFRHGGERCKPVGRAGSAPLKKLLQEYRVPPWLRDRIPLVYCKGELAAVAGCFVCETFAAAGEQGMVFDWQYD